MGYSHIRWYRRIGAVHHMEGRVMARKIGVVAIVLLFSFLYIPWAARGEEHPVVEIAPWTQATDTSWTSMVRQGAIVLNVELRLERNRANFYLRCDCPDGKTVAGMVWTAGARLGRVVTCRRKSGLSSQPPEFEELLRPFPEAVEKYLHKKAKSNGKTSWV